MTPQYTIPVTIGDSFSAGDRDHRLVEQREPFPNVAVLDQHVALPVDREGEQVAIPEALADTNGLARDRGSRGEVAGGLMLEHHRQEQVPALGALGLVLEQPLRAPEPARRRPDLAASREVQARSIWRSEPRRWCLRLRGNADARARASRRTRHRDRA